MKWVYYITAIALSISALYYTFTNVPFHSIWEYSLSIDYRWVFISTLINLLSFLIRAYRWKIIVNEIHPLKFNMAYHLTAIAFMMNSMLPGRLGEIARPIILNKRNAIPIPAGLTTVVTERLFDIIILCLLYLVVIMYVDIEPNYEMSIGNFTLSHNLLSSVAVHFFWGFLLFIFCIISLNIESVKSLIKICLNSVSNFFYFAGDRIQGMIERNFIHPVIKIIDHVSNGFSFFKRPSVIMHCFFLSMTLWVLIAVSNYLMTFGCKNMDVTFFEMCAFMVIICFFISLPSVPGAWGLWEAGGIFALTIFGVDKQDATGFTIVNHATQLFPVIVAGIISVFITGISIRTSR